MKLYLQQPLHLLLVRFFILSSIFNLIAQTNKENQTIDYDSSPTILNPAHEKNKSRVSYVPGIKVIRGVTQSIVPESEQFCPAGSVFKYNNGDIHVYNRRSTDAGKTWKQTTHILENSTFQYPAPDGEVIMFRSKVSGQGSTNAGRPEVSLQKTDKKGVFNADFYRSNDNGHTRIKSIAKIYIPEVYDEWSGVLCRKIVQLKDGNLLMSMYLRDPKGDNIAKQFRTIALKSTDRGNSWHYIATIAYDSKEDVRGEGFDETCLLVKDEGKLINFMRSGASYQASIGSFNNNDWNTNMPFSYGKQTPIYMNSSTDGGNNWSNADPIATHGVWPDALQLSNGIIAVSYGRPGNWLMFNNNRDENWGPIIPFYNDLYPPDCGNYISMSEVAPNVILVVYSKTNPNNHWKSEFVGTYFHVKKIVE